MNNKIGFIILRHVNSELTNQYWIYCYQSIRKYYPEQNILIIDDNSNYQYITPIELHKTNIIQSKYPKRGELLPYIYYLQNKFSETAVILHDSVFINKYINFEVYKYKLIWEFEQNKWDNIEDETKMIKIFNDNELLTFYENKNLWKGCFGGMTIITYDFLKFINDKYSLIKLVDYVLERNNRCSFERVLGCILQKHYKKETLLGDILKYCPWGIRFKNKHRLNHLPIIKIWTGR